jgi:hypothetical protein
MAETLNQYIDWLKNIKKIKLDQSGEDYIRAIKRMYKLADNKIGKEETGKKFLQGMDAQDKATRDVWWHGTHCTIDDESPQNEEMTELIKYLLKKKK